MTEQMQQALEKVAKGMQWANGQTLFDRKTLNPADPATTPFEGLVELAVYKVGIHRRYTSDGRI